MNIRVLHHLHSRALAAAVLAMLLCVAPSPAAAEITDEEVNRFVAGYLDAAQQPTIDAEVAHFAQRVRYFNSGTVDQDFIAADQRRYYQRWPRRSFELLDGPVIIDRDGDAVTARFTIRYEVRSADRQATGMTENTLQVRRFGDELRIVALSERKANPRSLARQSEKPRLETPSAGGNPAVPQPKAPAKPGASLKEPKGSLESTESVPKHPIADFKEATAVPGAPGFVYPPDAEHTPRNMLDVRGFTRGQKVKDPRTEQIFTVP